MFRTAAMFAIIDLQILSYISSPTDLLLLWLLLYLISVRNLLLKIMFILNLSVMTSKVLTVAMFVINVNNISDRICRYVYVLCQFQISHAWLQYVISYRYQTES
jgi:hypothetical protein